MADADTREGSLIALIGEQDTATGLLLTGIGNVDYRKNTNFLIVDESEHCSGPCLPSAGSRAGRGPSRLGHVLLSPLACPDLPSPHGSRSTETTQNQIEDAFRDFTSRDDIAVVLINQTVRRGAGVTLGRLALPPGCTGAARVSECPALADLGLGCVRHTNEPTTCWLSWAGRWQFGMPTCTGTYAHPVGQLAPETHPLLARRCRLLPASATC